MAIANAIGSNVFNILLGLGGPWLVSSLVYGEPTEVRKAKTYTIEYVAHSLQYECLFVLT